MGGNTWWVKDGIIIAPTVAMNKITRNARPQVEFQTKMCAGKLILKE